MLSILTTLALAISVFFTTSAHSLTHLLSVHIIQTAHAGDGTVLPAFDPALDAVQAPIGFGTGKTWQVGPTRTYKKPSDVVSLVGDGDIVLIDSATYSCDTSVKWKTNFLTLKGVGGRPVMDATGCGIDGGKGIWNPFSSMHDMIIDNIEFMGAAVGDQNGAGIRYDGTGYVYITNSVFHDNQDGILATPSNPSLTNIVIDHSEFANNGTDGSGRTHNMYISTVNSFVFRFSYSHDVHIGHEVKSRGAINYILYNRIADEQNGDSSYSIDIPQGGLTYIIGNYIQQGPNSPNYGIIAYSEEENPNPIQKVYISGNTIVNEGNSSASAFRLIDHAVVEAKMVNNLIVGISPTNIVDTAPAKATLVNNIVATASTFNQSNKNYILSATSEAVNKGIDPGTQNGVSLTPKYEYLPTVNAKLRPTIGALDVGAYEYDSSDVVTPAPTVTFAAANTTINYNMQATLNWTSTNASGCVASGAWSGSRASSGSFTTAVLISNKTYSITCTGPGGSTSKDLSITVNDSAATAALGEYVWKEIPDTKLDSVCIGPMADSSGNYPYKDNWGIDHGCPYMDGSTNVYVPELGKVYFMGGGGHRGYYGNEVYAYNFGTQKIERVTNPTLISQTKEYTPDDLYGSKVHFVGCDGIMHLNSGGIAPAPHGIFGAASYDARNKKIVIGPGTLVRGDQNCSGGGVEGQYATDMWSFDPFTNTWNLLAPQNDKFTSTILGGWVFDPVTSIGYHPSGRTGPGQGSYLLDFNTNPIKTALVDNNWPFTYATGPVALDTANHYALELSDDKITPKVVVFNLNGLSMTKYGTNGSTGGSGSGIAGGPGPEFVADESWTITGDTTLFTQSSIGITYNPKLQKFVAWTGGDSIYFLTPNYQTKVLDVLSKRVYSNPTGLSGAINLTPANHFTYIPDKDVYVTIVSTAKNLYYLIPPTSTDTVTPTPTPTPVTPTPTPPTPTPTPVTTPTTTPSTPTPVTTPASGLAQNQIDAILSLLRTFGATDEVIARVQAALGSGSTQTTPAPDTTPGIAKGMTIQTTAIVNVRNSASLTGKKVCMQSKGALGNVADGPVQASNYTWWKINYSSGCTGWTVASYVKPVGNVLGAMTTNFTHPMSVSWTGQEVTDLQQVLESLKFYSGDITGYFGSNTKAAVSAFQTANHIEVTGTVGPKTRALLNQLQ